MSADNKNAGSNVLVIGSGGREHTIAWSLAKSKRVERVIVSPGNGGTESDTSGKISNLSLDVTKHDEVVKVCRQNNINLVVVGPEAPLATGLVDALKSAGLLCFGPCKAAAQIEASKAFSKEFMNRHHIPTARFVTLTDYNLAIEHLDKIDYPVVIKASGLAAGKGVLIPNGLDEAKDALKKVMLDKAFGDAGDVVVIEEKLNGPEASILAFSDGYTVFAMPASQDHKRLLAGDKGLNTGGMGAYCPAPVVTPKISRFVLENVLQPCIDGLRKEGTPFVGCLYAGIMLDPKKGVQVLEYNCRFGDPETQVILPLLETDLYDIMLACANGCLDSIDIKFKSDTAATVVMASPGYPEKYPKGNTISGTDTVNNAIVFHAGTKFVQESDATKKLVTSGGRVLAVTGIGATLQLALHKAYRGINKIKFEGAQFREDIGYRALKNLTTTTSLYASAGVDIEAGTRAVEMMKSAVEASYTKEVISGLGSFGGLFDLGKIKDMRHPVLVASGDGVGTKIMVAAKMKRYDTIGQCLVNHCTNDILVQGAKPLFFLDYVAASKLNPTMIAEVVKGCAKGCKGVECALLGGETAEMPGVYIKGEFDVAGTIVGIVEKDMIIDGSKIAVGDQILALPSTGLHTNGYSLARKIFAGWDFNAPVAELDNQSLGDALLAIHKPYLKEFDALIKADININGLVHVTGGGLIDNPPRILPKHVKVVIERGSWQIPPLFQLIQKTGNVSDREMAHVFNCGLGMLVFVPSQQAEKARRTLETLGDSVYTVGTVAERADGDDTVEFSGSFSFGRKVRLGVLGSTRGTDMQAIIDAIEGGNLEASIEIVISNKSSAGILERAKKHGLTHQFIGAKNLTREKYDGVVSSILKKHKVDLVLLIGYMRIVSDVMVDDWSNKILNVHPSLLPAFAGGMDLNVHQAVLDAKCTETGCTIHFVNKTVDGGDIVLQKKCKVDSEETSETLKTKVQALEGVAFIECINLFKQGLLSGKPQDSDVSVSEPSKKKARIE